MDNNEENIEMKGNCANKEIVEKKKQIYEMVKFILFKKISI